jgi:hypothetical protein
MGKLGLEVQEKHTRRQDPSRTIRKNQYPPGWVDILLLTRRLLLLVLLWFLNVLLLRVVAFCHKEKK